MRRGERHPQTATAAVPLCHTVWVENERGEKLERGMWGSRESGISDCPEVDLFSKARA